MNWKCVIIASASQKLVHEMGAGAEHHSPPDVRGAEVELVVIMYFFFYEQILNKTRSDKAVLTTCIIFSGEQCVTIQTAKGISS